MGNSRSRTLGYAVGSVSIVVNLVLFALKIWAGKRTGSVAMVADAWHTLSDSFTSIVVVLGLWVSGIPKDEEHPFGHGRAESIGAIIIGTLLGVVAVGFARESVHQLRMRQNLAYDSLALIVFSCSVVSKELMATISIRIGKRLNSRSLIADGWHHRSDAIASALVLVGLFFGVRFWWIDGVLGLAVSGLILYAAWEIVKEASHSLLGEPAPEDVLRQIDHYVKTHSPDIESYHRPTYHRYGEHTEMAIHIVMADELDLPSAHRHATELERDIKRRFGIVATVHAEPKTGRRIR